MAGSISGAVAAVDPVTLPREEQAQQGEPADRTSQITGDRPIQAGASALGLTIPHDPDFSTPNTISARPAADSPVPTRSSRTPGSPATSAIFLVSTRMIMQMMTSPMNT